MKNPLQTFQRVITRIDNGKTITDLVEILIKGNPDRKLYDISKVNEKWVVKTYNTKGEHQVIETTETDETITKFIETLVEKFRTGRVLASSVRKGWYTYNMCENIFTRRLSRLQVMNILRYERDGTPKSTQSKAISDANPSLLPATIDFGDYSIDTWMKSEQKRGYFYSTFNSITKRHLDKLVYKY